MRKFVILILLLCFAVALPVSAASMPDLTATARFFPDSTPIFVSLHFDETTIATLDELLANVGAKIPGVVPPNTSVSGMLDLLALQASGQTFDNGIGQWFGDSIAIGILDVPAPMMSTSSQTEPMQTVIAIPVTDRDQAEAFLQEKVFSSYPENAFENELLADGSTLYQLTNDFEYFNVGFITSNDALLVGNPTSIDIIAGGFDTDLSNHAAFQAAFDLLPNDDYGIGVYINLQATLDSYLELAAMTVPPEQLEMLSTNAGTYPAVALGLTLLEGRSLVMDFAAPIGDNPSTEPYIVYQPLPAVSTDFAQHIPADAPFVMHGSNLKAIADMIGFFAQASLDQMAQLSAMSPPNQSSDMGFPSPAEMLEQFTEGLEKARAAFREATGLDLDEDVLGWMTGNWAMFLTVNADALSSSPNLTSSPVEWGVAIEATSAENATRLVDGITQAATQLETEAEGVTIAEKELGDGKALIIGVEPSPQMGTAWTPEFALGADEAVLALGTLGAAKAILDPANNLTDDPVYIDALLFVVENPTLIAYFNMKSLVPVLLAATQSESDQAQIMAVGSLISSAAISGTTFEDGSSIMRWSINLAE